MIQIHHSEPETSLFGVRVSRCELDSNDSMGLRRALANSSTDVCRVHISADDPDVLNFLNRLNIPQCLHYVSTRVSATLTEQILSVPNISPVEYQYRRMDASQAGLLKDLSYACVKDMAVRYFTHPLQKAFVDSDLVMRGLADYVSTFHTEDKVAYIGWTPEEKAIGFFVLEIKGDYAIAYLGGVLPEYRHLHVGTDGYLKIMRDFMYPMGIRKFEAEIMVQNLGSLKAAAVKGFGMLPTKSSFRFNIFPLLDHSVKEPILIQGDSMQEANAHVDEPLYCSRAYMNPVYAKTGPQTRILSFPILNTDYSLLLEKSMNEDGSITELNYFEYTAG